MTTAFAEKQQRRNPNPWAVGIPALGLGAAAGAALMHPKLRAHFKKMRRKKNASNQQSEVSNTMKQPDVEPDVNPENWRKESTDMFVEAARKRREGAVNSYKQIKRMGGDRRVLKRLEREYNLTPDEIAG